MKHLGYSSSFALLLMTCGLRAEAPPPADAEFFEKEVRPLLVKHCLKCHGDKKPENGLKLTSRAGVLQGGERGPAVIPGKPGESLLIQAITYNEKPKMPPKTKLSDKEIAILTRWVEKGVPWAGSESATTTAPAKKYQITEEQRRFWCFQPVKAARPPTVKDSAWPRNDLDRFILAALEAKGLKHAKEADKPTWLRRVTFDLIGLPPTPLEVDAFLKDNSSQAHDKVVDRLLASPHYGERWGRHWLDVVRYADSFDSRGIGGMGDIAAAWRYRDWVVSAFNRDMPYDQFVMDQIAGDLRPAKKPGELNVDGIIATGLLAIGNWGGGDADKDKLLTDIADDQVDLVGRAFLGLTVACARCHDHKFDPISADDYYGLAGIFFSTHILPNVGPKTDGPPMMRIPLLTKDELAKRDEYPKHVAELEKRLNQAKDKNYETFARSMLPDAGKYLLAAWDFHHRPANQVKTTVEEFAGKQGLQGLLFRQWVDYLAADEYQLLTTAVRNVADKKGVHAWRGQADCPNAVVNSTDKAVTILTFTLPPKSLALHPGPNNGVVLAWKSPIKGTVKLSGRVLDADPNGGDGIAWILDQRRIGSLKELARGEFPNGGKQMFSEGKIAQRLDQVEIQEGDRIELLILPKAEYSFDTTTIELAIAKTDDSAVWDAAKDLVEDFLKANPHADRQGHDAVWSLQDMAASNRAKRQGGEDPAKAVWERTLAKHDKGKLERADLEQAAEEFRKEFTITDARSPFWIRDVAGEKLLPAAAQEELALARKQVEDLKKSPLPPAPFAHGAQEGGVPGSPHEGVHDVRIHLRGSYERLGAIAPRHFPRILAGDKQQPITQGSGRLPLAQWLASRDNPLTSRVLVNRIWQHHFGEGIVRSASNFGKLGERPSHPELLDHLAHEFIESGWSIKKMHRVMVLSAAYRQSSEPSAEAVKLDPDNRLFSRMNRRRLESEAVRDNLLAVAGKMDLKLGGPATQDFNSPRRTLYQMNVRSDRSGFGPLFDVADSTAIVPQRTNSTVAPQALFLLNHPFVLEQTKSLAARLVGEKGEDADRVCKAYLLLYGRPPREEELKIGLDYLIKAAGADKKADQAWREYCQILLCANEFLYVD